MTSDAKILANLVKRMRNRHEDPLRPLIDEYLLKRHRSENRYRGDLQNLLEPPRPGGRLSPSTIGGCMRQAAFKFLEVRGRVKLDPDTQVIFDDGNWRHRRWQTTFLDMQEVLGKQKFEVLSTEQHVTIPELYIAGTSDNTLRMVAQRVRRKYALDIKGINDFGFNRLVVDDQPKEEHVDQLTTYMKAHSIWWGILFYENKNNQQTRSFVFRFNTERWARVEQWTRQVLAFLEQRKIPPTHPDCERGTFLYERCPYAGICFKQDVTRSQIERYAYRNFVSLEDSWRRGLASPQQGSQDA